MTREQRAEAKKMERFMKGVGVDEFTEGQLDKTERFLHIADSAIDDEGLDVLVDPGFDNQNQNSDLGSAFRELKNMGMEFN